MGMKDDVSPTGIKLEGQWEDDRNEAARSVFKDIIREVFGVEDVIIGHHLTYEIYERRADGFKYPIVQEIPSADTLIFDHDVAAVLWGDCAPNVLTRLALTAPSERERVLSELYYARPQPSASASPSASPQP